MNKIDQLSLRREDILGKLQNALTFSQATISLFGKRTSLNSRERQLFTRKYGIDIASVVSANKKRHAAETEREEANRIFTCDCCGKEYRNGDHHCDNKSGRHFCSNSCARKYSANSKTERSRLKTSESLKRYHKEHAHTLKCEKCGKEFEASPTLTHGKCKECRIEIIKHNRKLKHYYNKHKRIKKPTICKICGQLRKTCHCRDICKNITQIKIYSDIFGFDMSVLGTVRVYDEFHRVKTMLNDLYWNKNMSIPDMFNMFNKGQITSYLASTGNFRKLLKHFINFRNVTDGLKLWVNVNQRSFDGNFTTAKHISWNKKTFICKSTYEIDLCKELDTGKIKYIVEPFTVNYYDNTLKQWRFAIPDFYLPDFNTIIEVKSSFTYDRQNMIDKAKAYIEQGYNFILEYEHKSYTFHDMINEVFDVEKNITYYNNKMNNQA